MAAGAIDIHSHVVPADFPSYRGRAKIPHWPALEGDCGCARRAMTIDGRLFRTIEAHAWDVDSRIEVMLAGGIDRQLLSPLPELLSYWLAPADARLLCRHVNDAIGEMVSRAPTRFAGLGGVPLQDPDLAVRELELLMASGLFKGIEIGTNVEGIVIGDERFDMLFAAAESLGAAIFIHPERPTGRDRLVGPSILGNLVAHPCDTALAVTSLITGGVLERYPALRIAVAHGGGAFPYILPRLEYGWRTTPALAERITKSPATQARGLWWDNLVYDPGVIDFLIARFGSERICLGTDLPAPLLEGVPFAAIAHLSKITQDQICHSNALKYIGETPGGRIL